MTSQFALVNLMEVPLMPEHSRHNDPDASFVAAAKAADTGLSIGRRWVEVAVILVGLGIGVERLSGKVESAERTSTLRSEAIAKSLDDFKAEVRKKLETADSANSNVKELTAKVESQQRDIDNLKKDVAENFKIMMTYEAKKK